MRMPAAGAAHAFRRRLVSNAFLQRGTSVAPLAEGHSWPFLLLGPPFMAGHPKAIAIFFLQPRSRGFSVLALAAATHGGRSEAKAEAQAR